MKVTVKLTNEQMTELKNIEAKTRYEAMDKVAKILNATTGYCSTWSKTKKTIVIDENTHAEITFSKGKVTKIEYFDIGFKKFYMPIDIKNYNQIKNEDEAIKNLQRELGRILLPW